LHHGLQAVVLRVLPMQIEMAMRRQPPFHAAGGLRQH